MWENGGKFYSGGILNKRLNFQSDLFKKEGSDFSEEKKKRKKKEKEEKKPPEVAGMLW